MHEKKSSKDQYRTVYVFPMICLRRPNEIVATRNPHLPTPQNKNKQKEVFKRNDTDTLGFGIETKLLPMS